MWKRSPTCSKRSMQLFNSRLILSFKVSVSTLLAHLPVCRYRKTCDSCLRGPCSWNQPVRWMVLPPAVGDRHQSSLPVDSVSAFVLLQDMIQPAEAAKLGTRLRLWHLHSGRQTHTGCGAASKRALWLNRLRTARCHTKPVFLYNFFPSAVWLPLPHLLRPDCGYGRGAEIGGCGGRREEGGRDASAEFHDRDSKLLQTLTVILDFNSWLCVDGRSQGCLQIWLQTYSRSFNLFSYLNRISENKDPDVVSVCAISEDNMWVV